jgi:hypothetical protein
MIPNVRSWFSLKNRAKWLAVIFVGPPLVGIVVLVVIPWVVRVLQ